MENQKPKVVEPRVKISVNRYRVLQFGENYYIYDYKIYDLVKDDDGTFFKRNNDQQGKSEAEVYCAFLTRKHKISFLTRMVHHQTKKEGETCPVNQEQPTI